eukprot:scaffold21488_cov38-Tisochrysis_lutea.AAC.3
MSGLQGKLRGGCAKRPQQPNRHRCESARSKGRRVSRLALERATRSVVREALPFGQKAISQSLPPHRRPRMAGAVQKKRGLHWRSPYHDALRVIRRAPEVRRVTLHPLAELRGHIAQRARHAPLPKPLCHLFGGEAEDERVVLRVAAERPDTKCGQCFQEGLHSPYCLVRWRVPE